MKEYIKPIVELVSFATEKITDGPEMGGNPSGGDVGTDID